MGKHRIELKRIVTHNEIKRCQTKDEVAEIFSFAINKLSADWDSKTYESAKVLNDAHPGLEDEPIKIKSKMTEIGYEISMIQDYL